MAHPFVQHLIEDHDTQRRLGQEIQQAQAPEQRKKLRQEMYEELYPHVEGEEASVFDYLGSQQGEPRQEALKALQEHHVAKIVLRELMGLALDSDVFSAKAYVLDEMNRHHMEEEEKTHFPMLERMVDKKKMDQLFDQYQKAEKKAES